MCSFIVVSFSGRNTIPSKAISRGEVNLSHVVSNWSIASEEKCNFSSVHGVEFHQTHLEDTPRLSAGHRAVLIVTFIIPHQRKYQNTTSKEISKHGVVNTTLLH